MKNNSPSRTLPTLLFLSFSLLLVGCFSVKPAAKKGGKNLVETFYLGDQGTQYFIKPLLFKSVNDDAEFRLDATFRYNGSMTDSVVLNFSLIGNASHKSIQLLEISNAVSQAVVNEFKLLFNEAKKKKVVSRFSTHLPLNQLKLLFQNQDWTIRVNTTDHKYEFQPSRKSKKSIKKINANVFVTID